MCATEIATASAGPRRSQSVRTTRAFSCHCPNCSEPSLFFSAFPPFISEPRRVFEHFPTRTLGLPSPCLHSNWDSANHVQAFHRSSLLMVSRQRNMFSVISLKHCCLSLSSRSGFPGTLVGALAHFFRKCAAERFSYSYFLGLLHCLLKLLIGCAAIIQYFRWFASLPTQGCAMFSRQSLHSGHVVQQCPMTVRHKLKFLVCFLTCPFTPVFLRPSPRQTHRRSDPRGGKWNLPEHHAFPPDRLWASEFVHGWCNDSSTLADHPGRHRSDNPRNHAMTPRPETSPPRWRSRPEGPGPGPARCVLHSLSPPPCFTDQSTRVIKMRENLRPPSFLAGPSSLIPPRVPVLRIVLSERHSRERRSGF